MEHTNKAISVLLQRGQPEMIDNLFPGLLVYESSIMPDYETTPPERRLAAVYITDRISSLIPVAAPETAQSARRRFLGRW
jgi:hypothetical protein